MINVKVLETAGQAKNHMPLNQRYWGHENIITCPHFSVLETKIKCIKDRNGRVTVNMFSKQEVGVG